MADARCRAAVRLYVLPGLEGDANVAKAIAIGTGRATATDLYSPILESIKRSMDRAEADVAPPEGTRV